jgi:hypothetical protein
MALPSNVGTGTVTGRFIDSAGASIEGTVKFTPSASKLLNISADPSPVTILPKPVTVTLDGGSFTVALVATDDVDNNPVGWNYLATFAFSGSGVSLAQFSFDLPEGASVDLTEVAPVSSGSGVTIIRGPGVAVGGTTGQVLVKVSGDDFDTEWADPEAGGAVASVNGNVGAVVLDADDLADGSTNVQMLATERTKLTGVATAATANSADATLLARANHTGSQAQSTVTNLVTDLAAKAADSDVVKLTGAQTVAGVKTFSSSPAVPDASFTIAKSTGLQTALDAKAPLASPAFTGTPTGITKTHVGLGSVDNTADTAKPVSTAQQTALDLKAPIASPTFTGTVAGVTKTHVGLGSVDNTADTAKPVSTAQQTALNLKANLASPTFTGTVVVPDSSFTIAKSTGLQAALDAKGTSNLAIGTSGSTAKVGNYTPPIADLPAGSTITQTWATSWPARLTARTDITVQWIDPDGTHGTPGGGLVGDLLIANAGV